MKDLKKTPHKTLMGKIYKEHKQYMKDFAEKEKQEYISIPFPFEIGEEIIIVSYSGKESRGTVIKHSIKSYSVEDSYGNKYRIDKKTNYGEPNINFKSGVTERMKVGTHVKIKKSGDEQ